MKRLLPFAFAFASLLTLGAMVSCEKEKEPEKAIEMKPGQQTTQTVYADEEKAESTVSFTTTGAWTSSITETRAAGDWVSIRPSSGNSAGDYTVAIILDPNYTGSDRSATITITSGGENLPINVTQKAVTETGEKPVDPDEPKEPNGPVAVTGVTLNKSTLSLVEGDTETLTAIVAPENAENKAVAWSSSNSAVASVDASGQVTAVKAGSATITATTADGGKTATCTVTVTARTIAVTSVTLNKSTLSLVEGNTETLTATVLPSNATNKAVTWTSSNSAVASVDANGKVTAVKAGSATITATTADGGKTAICTVTVTARTIAVTSVTLNKTSLSLVEGNTETLTATVLPTNATNKAVAWSSSNSAVASVDANGQVTAVKAGTATITARTADGGKTATCVVTVSAIPVTPGGGADNWDNGGEVEL